MDKQKSSPDSRIVEKKQVDITAFSPKFESRPLPKLPRGWTRICNETALFLRGLSLGIVVTTYHGLFRQDFAEPTKVVIRKSRVTALLRTFIHFIPMGIALMEVILNMKGRYLGAQFDKQSYLQFVAKAHELTIQASLAAIVLSYIRYEVSLGTGIPFGAFLSSLQFSQVSYLWSTELWSAIAARDFRLTRKLYLINLIVPCAIIAAFAGPSSANLLIPKEGTWLMKPSSHYSINASFSDIWPDQLDRSHVLKTCSVLQNSPIDAPCPSYDWESIQTGLELLNSNTYAGVFEDAFYKPGLDFTLRNGKSGFYKMTPTMLCASSTADQFCASSPQEVILYGLDDAFKTWYDGIMFSTSFLDGYVELHSNYYEPYSIVSCVADYIDDSNKQDYVQFSRISDTNEELTRPRLINSLPTLTKQQALQIPRNISEYHLSWTELPTPSFNEKAIGAILLPPLGSPISTLRQNITTCTLKAGWGTSAVRKSIVKEGEYYSTITSTPSSWPVHTINQGTALVETNPNFANISGFQYPQRLISISPEWAAFLNPLILTGNRSNTSLINSYMRTSSTPFDEVRTAKLLDVMLTSGLGRHGVDLGWQVIPASAPACIGCLEFEVQHSLVGWSYNMQSTATKLAATVMFIYCILAFLHIVYSAIYGISSTAWDSSAEVVALAMNSTPTTHLRNTCGGIIGVKTFMTLVKVLAMKRVGGTEEHLELVFGEAGHQDGQWGPLGLNRKYG